MSKILVRRLIDADALYDKVEEKYKNSSGFYRPIYRGFVDDVADAPTVDAVEAVHGRWNPRPHHKFNSPGRLIKYCDLYYCSECGTERPMVPPYNYCPYCGAKMDGERRTNAQE